MADSAVQREREFTAWIKTQRQIHQERSQLPFVVGSGQTVEAATELLMPAIGVEEEPLAVEPVANWARGAPDGLLIAAAVLGACFGCPIGMAAGGAVGGFVAGVTGALLGELAVLGVARLLKMALRGVAAAYQTLHSLVR